MRIDRDRLERIALVNPPFSRLVYGNEFTIKSITPCLGLFYLKSYCRDIADFKIFEGEFFAGMAELIDEINDYHPDVLGVTTNTSTYPLCVELARRVDAKVKVAGGPYSSYRIHETLLDFDLVFVGDAETSFRDFLLGKPLQQIRGIAYKDGDGAIKETRNAVLPQLDKIPFPDHAAMQIGLYQASPHRQLEEPFATMVTSRGCGFRCTFCLSAVGAMNDGKYRERSLQNVIEEVHTLTQEFGVKSIQFWDDTFTMRKERTREMCQRLGEFDLHYVCNTRTDKMDDEIAELLYSSGCKGVFFGVESGNEDVLGIDINKGVRNKQVVRAIESCKKVGLQTTASFIFGSIDDTTESINDSIEFALELDPDFVLFNIYTAHPGTKGYLRAIEEGVIEDYKVDLERLRGEPVGVPTVCKRLSREELQILKDEAYIKYYKHKDANYYDAIIDTYINELKSLGKLVRS